MFTCHAGNSTTTFEIEMPTTKQLLFRSSNETRKLSQCYNIPFCMETEGILKIRGHVVYLSVLWPEEEAKNKV